MKPMHTEMSVRIMQNHASRHERLDFLRRFFLRLDGASTLQGSRQFRQLIFFPAKSLLTWYASPQNGHVKGISRPTAGAGIISSGFSSPRAGAAKRTLAAKFSIFSCVKGTRSV